MTICILAFETGVVYWCLSWASVLVLMFPVVRTVDEMGFFGKRTSVLFAGGLVGFCFWGLWYLVAHNKTLQGINDNTTFFLLAALLIYAACAVCLCVATVLGSIVKTLRTRRSESSNRTIIR